MIDGGVADAHSDWIVYRSEHVAPHHKDASHGSEIAGLMVNGQLNGPQICPEPDGCLLAGVAMIPSLARYDSYYGSEIALVVDLEQQVVAAQSQAQARLFCSAITASRRQAIMPVGALKRHRQDLAETQRHLRTKRGEQFRRYRT